MRFLPTIHVQTCATYITVIPSRKEITHTKEWENGQSMVPGKVDHTVRF